MVSVFDQADILALGEAHGRKLDSDLRIAVVRHPDFAKKVRTIVVEFGSTSEQSTLDRYIRGENISGAQLEQVWKTAGQAANGDALSVRVDGEHFLIGILREESNASEILRKHGLDLDVVREKLFQISQPNNH
jgi:hypothetical protein